MPPDCSVLRFVVRVVPAERAALSRSNWLVDDDPEPTVGRDVEDPDPAPVVGRVVPLPAPAPLPTVGRSPPVPWVGRFGESTGFQPPDPLLDSQPLPVLR